MTRSDWALGGALSAALVLAACAGAPSPARTPTVGDPDIDGDSKPDVIRLFTSVDYWGWLLFVRDRGCLRFVDSVYAYQLEPLRTKHHGLRDLRPTCDFGRD